MSWLNSCFPMAQACTAKWLVKMPTGWPSALRIPMNRGASPSRLSLLSECTLIKSTAFPCTAFAVQVFSFSFWLALIKSLEIILPYLAESQFLFWMIFLGKIKNHPFLNDFCINLFLKVRTDSLLERVARIELAPPGRKHGILPLNYTRMSTYIVYHIFIIK